MERNLLELSQAMRETAEHRGADAETLHYEADELLIETIRRLASTHQADVEELSEKIIRDWQRTPRWYA